MKFGFLEKSLLMLFIGLISLAIISQPAQKTVKTDKLDFRVLESDELYFKNLRQYFYTKSTREDAGFDLFTLKNTTSDPLKNRAFFTIVSNWRYDMAYVMFSVDSVIATPTKLVVSNSDTVAVSEMNMEEHQSLAVKVYASLADENSKFTLVSAGDELIEIWSTKEERKALRIILQDYFRLIGAM